ncbi:MAG: 3-oxoacyl-ACP synthase III family protein [Candidatus Woesearchaeota archaeon]
MNNLTFSPKIIGIESTLGSIKISNKEIADILKTTEEEILSKTGIINRYHCNPETENLYVLMATAASKAIINAEITIDVIDGIFTSSNPSGDYLLPNTTSIVASLLGKNEFYGWFGGSGCTGGILALENAYNKLAVDTMNGKMSYYLVIAGDQTSKMIERDSSDQILFSDSASAMIITNHNVEGWEYKLNSINMLTDTDNAKALRLINKEFKLYHDGKSIYKFASSKVPQYILKLLETQKFPKDKYLIAHQANLRIINNIAKELEIDNERLYTKGIKEKGNTSPTSVFIALDELSREKMEYTKIVLAVFGEGLNVGIAQIEKNNKNTHAKKQAFEHTDSTIKENYKKIYDEKWKF